MKPASTSKWSLLLLIVLLSVTCKNGTTERSLFTLLDNTGIHFENNISNTPDFNIFSYRKFLQWGWRCHW